MDYIFRTIQKFHMIEPGMKVVAGVSGGADSTCLLYVLAQYRKKVPFQLCAVHVEHGIRGKESLEDAAFTRQLCETFGVPCHTVPVPVAQIAREEGLSLEEAGRRERYRIFEEIRREYQADRIAVAHNQNDQAETVLWNLARGSGLKGLGGIRPVRGTVIRPLLFTDRKKIEEILTEAGLSWRTDATNLEQDYTRNRIRHSILPKMEEGLNSAAVVHITQAAQQLWQVQDYLVRMTRKAADACLIYPENTDGTFAVLRLEPYFRVEPLIQTELLKQALSSGGSGLKDVGSVHLAMLQELSRMDCGKKCHLPGGIRAVREDGVIRFFRHSGVCQKQDKEVFPLTIPGSLSLPGFRVQASLLESKLLFQSQPSCGELSCRRHENPEVFTHEKSLRTAGIGNEKFAEEKSYTKWISYDTINNDVCFRKRQAGDYLIINGQGGKKKLKDYMIDCKIPRDLRDEIWLLADGPHILWVVGFRISEAVKITEDTRMILKIQMEEEKK